MSRRRHAAWLAAMLLITIPVGWRAWGRFHAFESHLVAFMGFEISRTQFTLLNVVPVALFLLAGWLIDTRRRS